MLETSNSIRSIRREWMRLVLFLAMVVIIVTVLIFEGRSRNSVVNISKGYIPDGPKNEWVGNECDIFCLNAPKYMTTLVKWTDAGSNRQTRKVTGYMFYNPTIARISDEQYWVMGRFSWQFGTDCKKMKTPTQMYYCILAHARQWRDATLTGFLDAKTCSLQVRPLWKSEVLADWQNGSIWFDSKLLPIHSNSNTNGEIWVTSQKIEEASGLWWLNKNFTSKAYLIYQLMFVGVVSNHKDMPIRRLARAIFFDPSPTGDMYDYYVQDTGNIVLPPIAATIQKCPSRPRHLPAYPSKTSFLNLISTKAPVTRKKRRLSAAQSSTPGSSKLSESAHVLAAVGNHTTKDLSALESPQSSRRLAAWNSHRRVGHQGTVKEKNWTPFVWNNRVLWSYTINPHVICEMDVDLRLHAVDCVICVKQYYSKNETIWNTLEKKLVNETKLENVWHRLMIHLNGVPSFKIDDTNYFLGVAHAIMEYYQEDAETMAEVKHQEYIHFFYKMSATPPFEVVALSEPIDLEKDRSIAVWFGVDTNTVVAFVTGFEYNASKVGEELILSYGVGDRIGKLRKMSLDSALELFRPNNE